MARAWAISAGEVDFNISNLFCPWGFRPWLFCPWGFRPWCDEIDCRGPRSAVDALGVIPGKGQGLAFPALLGLPCRFWVRSGAHRWIGGSTTRSIQSLMAAMSWSV